MMPHIDKKDREMLKEYREKWRYFGEDGRFHMKEDTPKEFRELHKRIEKAYRMV